MKKVLEERDAVAYWGTAPTGRRKFIEFSTFKSYRLEVNKQLTLYSNLTIYSSTFISSFGLLCTFD